MITKEKAKEQLARLARMMGFPDNKPSLEDMILALQVAKDDKQAVAAIDNFIETATSATRCPMPAEIRRWIYERQEAEGTEARRRTATCPHCEGTGQVIVERNGYSGAKTCECRKVMA